MADADPRVLDEPPPPRIWAFTLTVLAALALSLPIVYTFYAWRTFGPFGTFIAWTAVCFSLFGIVTVVISVIRAFVKPAWEMANERLRGNGNL